MSVLRLETGLLFELAHALGLTVPLDNGRRAVIEILDEALDYARLRERAHEMGILLPRSANQATLVSLIQRQQLYLAAEKVGLEVPPDAEQWEIEDLFNESMARLIAAQGTVKEYELVCWGRLAKCINHPSPAYSVSTFHHRTGSHFIGGLLLHTLKSTLPHREICGAPTWLGHRPDPRL